jgi:hypothetical protein
LKIEAVYFSETSTSAPKNTWHHILKGVHFADLLDVHNILSADTGISRKTEGNSFGDHLIIGLVSVTPSGVIEAYIVV